MKAYRIGRVQLPWTNLVPPIQGGVHRKLESAAEIELCDTADVDVDMDVDSDVIADSTTDDSAEVSSLFSIQRDPLSSDEEEPESVPAKGDDHVPSTTCRLRVNKSTASADKIASPAAAPMPTERLSREAYTAAMEQKEIADGIRSYPSLDQQTQDAIRTEYRALHKLVQDRGLYECRYSEYGKEAIRYSIIFGGFLFFLRHEWYITSAVCLGLFWVCYPLISLA